MLSQAELLQAAAPLVKPGGVLCYSTCSIEPEENEQQIAAFLQHWPSFSRRRLGSLPAGIPAQVLSREGDLAMLPHVHATDGAFAACLQRHAGDVPWP